jgi:hypothetical protein
VNEFPTQVRVTQSRVRDHTRDIRFSAGDAVVVGHRNRVYPEFVWCTCERGDGGWAPEAYLESTGPRAAVALRDYDASHLTVSEGEILVALEQVGVWVLCRNDAGAQGWVRSDALEPVAQS